MAQDVIKRRRSEITYMNGHVVSKGKEAGIATPVSAVVVGIVEEIDAGTRKPAPESIELALRRAGF
jgi:ketopantoate reductase